MSILRRILQDADRVRHGRGKRYNTGIHSLAVAEKLKNQSKQQKQFLALVYYEKD